MSVRRDAVWTALDTVVGNGIVFLFRLALARVLLPGEFALIAMAMTPVAILQVINDFGLSASVIQRDEERFSDEMVDSAFSVSIIIATALFLLTLSVVAPLTASYFGAPRLQPLIAAMGISFLFTPISSMSRALLYRRGQFRSFTIARVGSTLTSVAIGGIALAITQDVWAFVIHTVAAQMLLAGWSFAKVHWHPRILFNREAIHDLLGFSGLVFATDVAVVLARTLDVFVIGRFLTSTQVGLYSLAFYVTDTARAHVMSILNRVMFVHYSRQQRDLPALRNAFVETLDLNTRIVFPVMACIIAFAPPVLTALLGPAWEQMATALRLLGVVALVHSMGGSAETLLKAVGRPGLNLILFLVTTFLILVPAMIVGVRLGQLEGAAVALVVGRFASVLVRQIALDRVIGATFGRFIQVNARNLARQAPILVAWWILQRSWPGRSWYVDAGLGIALFAIYGGAFLMTEWKRTRGNRDDKSETLA